ncbi:hypothetical protein V8G54_009788 [Vigna mungo]|uniref:Uncharacterized protein n=1 Tax=Vigna mungo TaxID=3915 RepID=A0AAQ3NXD3_VIGMU
MCERKSMHATESTNLYKQNTNLRKTKHLCVSTRASHLCLYFLCPMFLPVLSPPHLLHKSERRKVLALTKGYRKAKMQMVGFWFMSLPYEIILISNIMLLWVCFFSSDHF